MDITNVHCNPHCLQGRLAQPDFETNVSKEANLHQTSMVPEQVNQRQDLAENYYTTSQHIGNETTDIGLMPKNAGAFTMDPHKTTFEPAAADLDSSIYYACGPSPNASNLFMRQPYAEYPLNSRSKRQNSGGGDDRDGGKKRRLGDKNDNTGPEIDGADRSGGSNNGNGGRGTDEGDNAPNPTGNTDTPSPKSFACLLYKLDPEKYNRCANCVLTTWGRVLQHLKRIHLLKGNHCPTCRLSSDEEDAEAIKNSHIRSGNCQPVDITQAGILIQEDYKKLKNIRADSDEEKWNMAWDKLFPHLETPSAFAETHLEFIRRNARPTCLDYLQRAQGHQDLESLALELATELTRTPTPAARAVGSGQALQAPSSCPASAMGVDASWPLNTSGQTAQVPPGLMMMPPSQQPAPGQPQQVPLDLSAQVNHHSGMSAQESFDLDAYGCGPSGQGFPEINPPPIPSEQAPSLPNPDVADFSDPGAPFAMRDSLQGIGASFPTLFLDNPYMQDEDDMCWPFSTSPQPDPGNQGSGDHS